MKIIELLSYSYVAGFLMYLGGEGNKQIKRIGIPLITLFAMWRMNMDMVWYCWILTFGFLYFSMTTYLSTLFGDDDTVDAWEWVLTGFLYGIVLLPYIFVSGHWIGFGIRTIILSFLIWIWSIKFGNVFIESFGRGFFIIITLPILLI